MSLRDDVEVRDDQVLHLCLDVFGLQIGQTLSLSSGLNEFLSAFVAAKTLAPYLQDVSRASVQAFGAGWDESTGGLRKAEGYGWSVGLRFEQPLGNQAARHELLKREEGIRSRPTQVLRTSALTRSSGCKFSRPSRTVCRRCRKSKRASLPASGRLARSWCICGARKLKRHSYRVNRNMTLLAATALAPSPCGRGDVEHVREGPSFLHQGRSGGDCGARCERGKLQGTRKLYRGVPDRALSAAASTRPGVACKQAL